jgi:hypothetical protein
MVIGATYRLATNMNGYAENFRFANQSAVSDTLSYKVDTLGREKLRIGDELGVGISVRGGEKWNAEFNYTRSNWKNSGIDNAPGFSVIGDMTFRTTVSQSFRAGFEITPNRNDIRYYLKTCTYRAGLYFDQEYYTVNNMNVNTFGITIGATLPVFRLYNGLTVGVDFGQRAADRQGMIRERYVMFNIGFNIHDIWFQKPRYN